MTGVEKLLQQESGSPSAIAAKLSTPEKHCSRQLVQYWGKQGYVSGTWAPRVNSVYGIALHELNPAIYPDQTVAA